MTPIPGSTSDAGATNTPDSSPGSPESGQDDSGQLRAEESQEARDARRAAERALAVVLDPAAFDDTATINAWKREARQDWAVILAGRALRRGYRLVSVDDDTVERVARALFGDFDGVVDGMTWDEDSEESREAYRSRARAAVQALRDGNSQPTPSSAKPWSSHACCPHCTARKGSCVRCGVRDAEGVDGEQLCGPCDSEVEAEALRDGGEA